MATAVNNLSAIPRHDGGATRVNAGRVGGGTASNVVPEEAFLEGEVRGETTALMEYMEDERDRVLEAAARMHDCDLDFEQQARAPSAESDAELASVVSEVADGVAGVDSVCARDALGGSEDATYLMRRVQERGGLATYVTVGTDHPGGHHTGTFDVDESDIGVAVTLLADTVVELGRRADR
jgi:aminobenzoyl-glutamate utilization protein A